MTLSVYNALDALTIVRESAGCNELDIALGYLHANGNTTTAPRMMAEPTNAHREVEQEQLLEELRGPLLFRIFYAHPEGLHQRHQRSQS
jgi:hypothetical protein